MKPIGAPLLGIPVYLLGPYTNRPLLFASFRLSTFPAPQHFCRIVVTSWPLPISAAAALRSP